MGSEKSYSEQEVNAQLTRITASPAFAKSARLKDFLGYIVSEAIAGHASRIKAVTIAQSVFAADESFDPESNSIVRVEAGRLRRRLSEYYAGPGRADPILISVPKGSYAPAFQPNPHGPAERPPKPATARSGDTAQRRPRTALLLAALAAVLLAWWALSRDTGAPDSAGSDGFPVGATESQILFDQAFRVLMPPGDRARMSAAQLLFERVIELSPEFAGGYSGKSLTHSIRVLFLKSDDPAADLDQANTLARRALDADGEFGLAYSALAVAYALAGDEEQALQSARRAITAEQQGATANAMAALGLLVAGYPREAIDSLEKAMAMNPGSPRTPYLNLLGIAYYVSGDDEQALALFEENLDRGGPTGPHMDVFVAATYGRLGRQFEATAVVERLARSDPDYPAAAWVANYQKSPADQQETMDLLRQSGWSGS